MTFKPALLGLSLVLAATAPATAQDFYGSIWGGYSQTQDSTFSGAITPPGGTQTIDLDFDSGFTVGGAIGRDFGEIGNGVRLRGEIELSYSEGDVDGVNFSGNGAGAEVNVGGDITTTRLMANALLDFQTDTRLTPYIGAGVGAAFSDIDVVYGSGVNLNDSSTDFAAQIIGGASYAINDGTSLFADVRYIRDFGVESQRFTGAGGMTGLVEDDIETVQVNFGVRFNF